MPRRERREIAKSKLILGEGQDERLFFTAMLTSLKLEADVQAEDFEGKSNLGTYLDELRRSEQKITHLIVTRDADSSESEAFDSVKSALRTNGYEVPLTVGQLMEGKPFVAVFIMPGPGEAGALEDLCLKAIGGTNFGRCVDEAYIKCLAAASWSPKDPISRSKARVRAWLAAQRDPEKLLGMAAQEGYFPLDDPRS